MKRVNVPIAFASLGLSVMLWFVVYAQNLPAQYPVRIQVQLQSQGLDDNHYTILTLDPSVKIRMQGPSDRIQAFRDGKPSAFVDLTDARVGTGTYPVQIFPQWAEQYLLDKPISTRVVIDSLVKREFQIVVEGKGDLSDKAIRLDQTRKSRDKVMVIGAESRIAKVDHVRAVLDLARIDPENPGPQETALTAVDADDQPVKELRLSPPTVMITPLLTTAPSEKLVVVSAKIVGSPANGMVTEDATVEPQQVTLAGKPLILAAVSNIETEEIDVSHLTTSRTFVVPLRIPLGTVIKGKKTVSVRIKLHRVGPTGTEGSDSSPSIGNH